VLDTLNAASEIYKRHQTSFFIVKKDDTKYRIAKSDIIYFDTENHYINIHTFDMVHKFRSKLSELNDEFAKPMFAKCNRGIILNVEHIFSIHKDRVMMVNKEELPLSRVYWEDINRCYLAVHVDPDLKEFINPTQV